jgi:hypothetical protein
VPVERRVTYWIGTDVYDSVHDVERHERAIAGLGGVHLAGSPWMTDELRRIGIDAATSIFPTTVEVSEPVSFPSRFRVSSYVPDLRPDFYGRLVVEELARRLPETEFDVWGSSRPSPVPNLRHRGHTDDMLAAIDDCVVHVRLTRHDAIAATVREALSRARYVLFPYRIDGVISVAPWDVDRATNELARLRDTFDCGELPLNETGREAAQPLLDSSNAVALAERLMSVGQRSSR